MADSRSSEKTTEVGGKQRLYDANQKVRGRKRHMLVDNEVFVSGAEVHSAKVMDRYGTEMLLRQAYTWFARLEHLWVGALHGRRWGAKTGQK